MSIEEKRREKFEAYIRKSYSEHCAEEGEGLFQREDSGYSWYWVDELWRVYVDALDSVEIELPQPWTEAFMKSESMLQDCKFAIESAGLKVKP